MLGWQLDSFQILQMQLLKKGGHSQRISFWTTCVFCVSKAKYYLFPTRYHEQIKAIYRGRLQRRSGALSYSRFKAKVNAMLKGSHKMLHLRDALDLLITGLFSNQAKRNYSDLKTINDRIQYKCFIIFYVPKCQRHYVRRDV